MLSVVRQPPVLPINADGQCLVAPHEARIHALWLADHLDIVEAFEDFLPDDLELELREPHADAAMKAESERQMGSRTGTVDDEAVGVLDRRAVAVAGDVPHHDAVALPDELAADFGILQR